MHVDTLVSKASIHSSDFATAISSLLTRCSNSSSAMRVIDGALHLGDQVVEDLQYGFSFVSPSVGNGITHRSLVRLPLEQPQHRDKDDEDAQHGRDVVCPQHQHLPPRRYQ